MTTVALYPIIKYGLLFGTKELTFVEAFNALLLKYLLNRPFESDVFIAILLSDHSGGHSIDSSSCYIQRGRDCSRDESTDQPGKKFSLNGLALVIITHKKN